MWCVRIRRKGEVSYFSLERDFKHGEHYLSNSLLNDNLSIMLVVIKYTIVYIIVKHEQISIAIKTRQKNFSRLGFSAIVGHR